MEVRGREDHHDPSQEDVDAADFLTADFQRVNISGEDSSGVRVRETAYSYLESTFLEVCSAMPPRYL